MKRKEDLMTKLEMIAEVLGYHPDKLIVLVHQLGEELPKMPEHKIRWGKICEMHINNPDMSEEDIAFHFLVTRYTVRKALSEYYNTNRSKAMIVEGASVIEQRIRKLNLKDEYAKLTKNKY